MNKICTTIEQSKKLIELGIDINTADMYYQYFKSYSPSNGVTTGHCDIPIIGSWKEHHISIPDPAMPNADIPAWSLSALLELISNWQMQTQDNGIGILYGCKEEIKIIEGETPLDVAFQMVVWLKENGYIKK